MIKSHTKRRGNSLPYIFIFIFISGIIVGALFARLSPYTFVFQRTAHSKTAVFKNSFIAFLKPCFIIWLSGYCKKAIYFSSAVLAYRGGLTGFVISSIFREYGVTKGLFTALSATLPQNLLFFPFLLFLCMASSRHKNTNDRGVYLIMLLLSAGISAFSAFVDTFITSFFIKFTI